MKTSNLIKVTGSLLLSVFSVGYSFAKPLLLLPNLAQLRHIMLGSVQLMFMTLLIL